VLESFEQQPSAVVIDLAGVDTCDCNSLGQGLVFARNQAYATGIDIFFINRRQHVEDLLVMYKLDSILSGTLPFRVRFVMRYGPAGNFDNKKLGERFYEKFLPQVEASVISDVFALKDALLRDESFTEYEQEELTQDLFAAFTARG
jgi:hypothetical protein